MVDLDGLNIFSEKAIICKKMHRHKINMNRISGRSKYRYSWFECVGDDQIRLLLHDKFCHWMNHRFHYVVSIIIIVCILVYLLYRKISG